MRRIFPTQRSEKGFTLPEILTVIVIIGILAAIATPIYLAQKNKATAATVQADLSSIAIILNQLRAQNDGDYIYNDYWDKRVPGTDADLAIPANTNLWFNNAGPGNLVPTVTTADQQSKGITNASRKSLLNEIKVSKGVTIYLPRVNKGTCIVGYASGISNTTYHYDLVKRRGDVGNCPPPDSVTPDTPSPGATTMILSGTATETISLESMAINRSGSLSVAGGSPTYKYVIKNSGAQVSATKSRLTLNATTGLSDNGYIELTSDGKWSVSNVNTLGSITVQIEVTDRFGEKITGSKRFVATPAGSLLETPTLEVAINAAGGGDVKFSAVENATQYRIEYSSESDVTGWQTASTFTNITEGAVSYQTTLGTSMMPEPGTTFYYRVRAEAPSGGSAPGNWSTVVAVQGIELAAPVLTATKLGMDSAGQQVKLDWARVPNAHSTYYLYIDGSRSGTKIEPGAIITAPFERTIAYAVAATSPSESIEGPKSNSVSISTVWEVPVVTAATVSNSGASTIITWNKPATNWGASSMQIELSTSATFASNVTTLTAPSSSTTFQVNGTIAQGSYYARAKVQAVGGVTKTSANRSFSTANYCADLNAAAAGYAPAVVNGNAAHETRRASVHNATPIWRMGQASGGEFSGPVHFRKAFYVPTATTVTFTALADNNAAIQLNGAALLSGAQYAGTPVYTTRSLPAGCHIITAKVTNEETVNWVLYGDGKDAANPGGFLMSVRDAAGKNLTLTDATWKMWNPGLVHYSHPAYYHDRGISWANVRDLGQVNSGGVPWAGSHPNWGGTTGDGVARYIAGAWGYGLAGSHDPTWNYHFNHWTHFRASEVNFNSSNARVWVTCDDMAYIYVNGVHRGTCNGHGTAQAITVPLAGRSVLGISVFNGGTAGNPTMLVADLYLSPGGPLLIRSDQWWTASRPTAYAGSFVRSLDRDIIAPAVSNTY